MVIIGRFLHQDSEVFRRAGEGAARFKAVGVALFKLIEVSLQNVAERKVQRGGGLGEIPCNVAKLLGKVLFVERMPLRQPFLHDVDRRKAP